MDDASGNDTTQRNASSAGKNANEERVISAAERVAAGKLDCVVEAELRVVADSLISLYDSVFKDRGQRNRAVRLACSLAKRYDLVLDLVIENARRYVRTQHIDDAFPYAPSSFDVLAEMGKGSTKVIAFLIDTVRKDWGIPRWKAVEILCKLDDPVAEGFVVEVIQGKHPSRNPDVLNDLRPIEQVKGRDFVKKHQLPAHGVQITTDKPVAQVCIDRFRGAIWASGSAGRVNFEVRLECKDERSGQWRGVDRLGFEELLVAKRVLDLAHSRITELQREIQGCHS